MTWLPVTLAALLLVPAASASAQAPVVLGEGHVDFAARMSGGALVAQVKDGTTGSVVWREPASVVFAVRPAARTVVPDDPRLAFLGRPGEPTWLMPQVQRPGVLWAGWNTEELTAAELDGPVTWSLLAVEGPGAVAVFQTASFGRPDVLFDSRDGLPDARAVPLGAHAHGNWAFSAAGEYRLTFEYRGTTTAGQVVSDVETLPVTVEAPAPGAPPPAPDGTPPPPGGEGSEGERPRVSLDVRAPRVRGRRLSLRVRLGARSRIQVMVRRRGRTVARTRERTVRAGDRRVTLRLTRRLKPGRYVARVRARVSGRTTAIRTLRLVVRKPRRKAPAAAAVVATAAATTVAAPARTAAAAGPVTLDEGHVDYAARIVGGRLQSQIKDGTRGAGRVVWREPSAVVFRVPASARTSLPSGGGLGFLGEPGAGVWMIPQVQDPSMLWAGWNTEALDRDDLDGALTWRLTQVSGPGPVALFLTGSFGEPEVIFDSADGLPDRYSVPLGTHAHGNWAFPAQGRYRLTFEMSGTRPSGARMSDTETLEIVVGDATAGSPPSEAEPPAPAGRTATSSSAAPAASGERESSLPDTGAMVVSQGIAAALLVAGGVALRRRIGSAAA